MRSTQILKQVIYMNTVEQQGIAVSGDETIKQFVKGWFGDVDIVAGGYENNSEYFYSYNEQLKGIADMILMSDTDTIYLYLIEE